MSDDLYPAARIRDVPRSCICLWRWNGEVYRWVLNWPVVGCPWHEGGKL